jgi:hypothetical protein
MYDAPEYTGKGGSLAVGIDTILSVDDWKAKEVCEWKPSTKFESAGKDQRIPGNTHLDITFELNVNKNQLVFLSTGGGGLGIRGGNFVEDLILDDGKAITITCPVISIDDVQFGTPQGDRCRIVVTAKTDGDYTIAAHGTGPVANFTGTPRVGADPLIVVFTDTSTGTPTSWLWDFKNDGTAISALQNPTYIYTAAGTYTVKLKATNADGSSIKIKEDYIVVS